MTDTFTTLRRSEIMSRITAKNTAPEKLVRKILFGLGCRYRLHDKKLAGRPDIVIKRRKAVVFVNGCFWHQHRGCKRQFIPKSNKEYWIDKLKNNVKRQKNDIRNLEREGWKVFIIWECQTKNRLKLINRIKQLYEKIDNI